MERRLLESYQTNKRLIERTNKKIEDESFRDIPVVAGKVKGSNKGYPYIEQRFSVQVDEPYEAEKQRKKLKQWKTEIKKAEKEMEEVENYIAKISDARVREIFTYRFMDGMKVKEVAEKVGYTHSRISQIISEKIKD